MKKLIFVLSAVALIACKNGEKATKNESDMKSSNPQEQTDPKNDPNKAIVSFISMGAGIDHKMKTKFEEGLASFNKENNLDLKPELRHWGREGEIDLIFDMKNLSTKQRNAFNSFVKETIGDSQMVNFKE